MKYNKDLAGIQITDELINRATSASARLVHDTILASTVVVRTAPAGGGTLLSLTTDYTLGSEDARLTTEAGGTVNTTLAIVNGAFQNTNLYVTYKTVGDYTEAEDINELSEIVGPSSLGVPFPRYEVAGLPAMSSRFAACSGQLISDAQSLYNGTRLPNLNGANVVLTLTFTANAGGATATVAAADRPAIALHDWVTGSGIAALTYVKSFDYSTGALVISDPAATGSKSATFSNEGRGVIGGTAFGSVGDTGQIITGNMGPSGNEGFFGMHRSTLASKPTYVNGAFVDGLTAPAQNVVANTGAVTNAVTVGFDSSKSPNARTGNKTKSDAYRMTYYMRIK
jgi:hypothetical protein